MLPQVLSRQVIPLAPQRTAIIHELPADLETPVSVYLKLAGQGPSFLLESVSGAKQLARYSFIGVQAQRSYVLRGRALAIHSVAGVETKFLQEKGDFLDSLRSELNCAHFPALPDLPRFIGGLAGYLSYDAVRFFEPSVALPVHPDLPDAVYLLAETLVVFDHVYGRMLLIAIADLHRDPDLQQAESRLEEMRCRLSVPLAEATPKGDCTSAELTSNLTKEQFMEGVRQAKEYIAAGDIFQVVLSQRLSRQTGAAPFDIYRTLRRLNPSPYMYFFDFGDLAGGEPFQLIGASPEMHVRLEGRNAMLRPIAGTRRRGQTEVEDNALVEELLADPKERAEHVMLVDLGRNDLGRVCKYGSVRVTEKMKVERYSHVMHIVSQVEGQLADEHDAFDLLRATFPAGTVSGAPKIRAMQIIHELEAQARGPYAGAVGYFSFDGSLDTCITIRTLVMRGNQVSVQAGAGIVADSDPATEYEETMNKARALAAAVKMAEQMA